jgi:hypothetical protein
MFRDEYRSGVVLLSIENLARFKALVQQPVPALTHICCRQGGSREFPNLNEPAVLD